MILRGVILSLLVLLGGQQSSVFGGLRGKPTAVAGGAITYAWNGCGFQNGSGGGNVACTLSSSLTAGQTEFIDIGVFNTSPTITVSHTNSGTLSNIVTLTTWGSAPGYDAIYQITGTGAGADTISATVVGGAYSYISVYVFSGGSIDSQATASVGSSTTGTCNSLTTSAANELLLGFVVLNGGGTVTGSSSPQTMTVVNGYGPNGVALYGTATTAGSNTATFGNSSGTQYLCQLISVH